MSSVMFYVCLYLLFFLMRFHGIVDATRFHYGSKIQLSKEGEEDNFGTQWAVLLAGSSGYSNYRHQADICHAYQILKRGGLKDENIIVLMYDDIANNSANPRPGIIINNPNGSDVYAGVPKDYTGKEVTADNFIVVILGDKESVKGGSGKVVDSGPNDHIFIYYTGHGGPGALSMPVGPSLYAKDFIDVLKGKHAANAYKQMVIYVEACEGGSIFEGLLPEGMNIYVTTASNAKENSYGTYCPGMGPSPPLDYGTCLGDLYSVAWMEDSDVHNRMKETLEQQYQVVKERTSNNAPYGVGLGSHVMQYGDIPISEDPLSLFMGSDPENANATSENSLPLYLREKDAAAINQQDAELLYVWQKYKRSKPGSTEKLEAQQELIESMSQRLHLNKRIDFIGKLLFGSEMGATVLKAVRPSGQPLVDDWGCLKTMVRKFESHCGSLSQYGMKHMRALANICNNGVSVDTMAKVSAKA